MLTAASCLASCRANAAGNSQHVAGICAQNALKTCLPIGLHHDVYAKGFSEAVAIP